MNGRLTDGDLALRPGGSAPSPWLREALADELGVGDSNLTGIVGRLEEKGVVARVHDADDRRMVRAQLTPAGIDMLRRVEDTRLSHMRQLIESLTADERATVLRAFQTLTTAHERVHSADGASEHNEPHPHDDKELLPA